MRSDQICRCRTDNRGHWKENKNEGRKSKQRRKERRIRGEGIEEEQARSHGKQQTYEGEAREGERKKGTEGKERKGKQEQESGGKNRIGKDEGNRRQQPTRRLNRKEEGRSKKKRKTKHRWG